MRIARAIFSRILPLPLRSYILPNYMHGIDKSTWDKEYKSGQWERLGELNQMPRYSVIAGYCKASKPDARILDVGCGDGQLYEWLFPNDAVGGDNYLGIDLSDVAIEKAREKFSGIYEVADATTFVPKEKYDVIILNEMLYYMKDPEKFIRHYTSFLNEGGFFIISMWRSVESLQTWRKISKVLNVVDEVETKHNKTSFSVRLCQPTFVLLMEIKDDEDEIRHIEENLGMSKELASGFQACLKAFRRNVGIS